MHGLFDVRVAASCHILYKNHLMKKGAGIACRKHDQVPVHAINLLLLDRVIFPFNTLAYNPYVGS